MENKTLQDFADELARENGHDNFCQLENRNLDCTAIIVGELSIAAERYAVHVAEQACRKQRELCAEHAGIKILWTYHLMKAFPELEVNTNRIIASDSILNAPLATDSK